MRVPRCTGRLRFSTMSAAVVLLAACESTKTSDGSTGGAGVDGSDGGEGADGAGGEDATDTDEDDDGVPLSIDCDDLDPAVGAPELRHMDRDGDGFGTATVENYVCEETPGWVVDATDCDDLDAAVSPAAAEVCNGIDDNCDSRADDDDPSVDTSVGGVTGFTDADGDGYGDPSGAVTVCALTDGIVDNDLDCDDLDITVNPEALEICDNGIDEDCDGGASGCTLAGELLASDADALLASTDGGNQAGFAVVTADIDGDGYADVVAGAPVADTSGGSGSGAVYLHFGGAAFADATMEDGIELAGQASADILGYSLASPGDLDGDGTDDLVVGDPGRDEAWVVLGGSRPTSGALSDQADVRIDDGGADLQLGFGVAEVGDVNGDGLADFIVGESQGGASYAGVAWLFHGDGAFGGSLSTDDAAASFTGGEAYAYAGGRSASSAGGDLDGDGLSDVVIAARGFDGSATNIGRVGIFSGAAGATSGDHALDDAGVLLTGVSTDGGMYFGGSVCIPGDWDGDGLDDLAVGAYFDDSAADRAGAVFVFPGRSGGLASGTSSSAAVKVTGLQADDYLGYDIGCVGDLDRDGDGDLLVYAQNATTPSAALPATGAAYLFSGGSGHSGSLTASAADAVVYGTSSRQRLGASSAAGDINGDGNPDLALGAYGDGEVYVVFGRGY